MVNEKVVYLDEVIKNHNVLGEYVQNLIATLVENMQGQNIPESEVTIITDFISSITAKMDILADHIDYVRSLRKPHCTQEDMDNAIACMHEFVSYQIELNNEFDRLNAFLESSSLAKSSN